MALKKRFKKGPVPIGEVISELSQALKEKAFGRGKVATLWEKITREKKGLHTKISTFEEGILTVLVDNSSALYELSLEKETFLRKLQKEFGKNAVREIRLQIGDPLHPHRERTR